MIIKSKSSDAIIIDKNGIPSELLLPDKNVLISFFPFSVLDFNKELNLVILNSEPETKKNTLKTRLIVRDLNRNIDIYNTDLHFITNAIFDSTGSQIIFQSHNHPLSVVNLNNKTTFYIDETFELTYAIKHADLMLAPSLKSGTYVVYDSHTNTLKKHHVEGLAKITQILPVSANMVIVDDLGNLVLLKGTTVLWKIKLPPSKPKMNPWISSLHFSNAYNCLFYNYAEESWKKPNLHILKIELSQGTIIDEKIIDSQKKTGTIVCFYNNSSFLTQGQKIISLDTFEIVDLKYTVPN